MGKLVTFHKYQGTGNDFVIIDARNIDYLFNTEIIYKICDRHFGIGADGFILLLAAEGRDFYMKYYNSDGLEGSMCGNGGRCITAFAKKTGIIKDKAFFSGIDGDHHAVIAEDGIVSLKMKEVSDIVKFRDGYLLDTGSPHFVVFGEMINETDVVGKGRKIRNQSRFSPGGTNVNFIEPLGMNEFAIRTYERGVEDETLACGTGSVAAAIAFFCNSKPEKASFTVHAPGGKLWVKFKPLSDKRFTDIWLEGPAEFVFQGEFELP